MVALIVVAWAAATTAGCSSSGPLGSFTSEDAGSGGAVAPPSAIATDDFSSDFDYRVQDSKNPAKAHIEAYKNGEAGQPLSDLERVFASLKARHLAFRGVPPRLTMHVKSATATEVVLIACEHPAKSGTWTEYDTRTGKTVTTSPDTDPFSPYQLTVRVTISGGNGESAISAITPNTAIICGR
ncbi:MAG: hypothetical protein J2P16_04485 [Mycobacterium sp.]|nr:hypothetical protein [Mycobacterium sp.]